MPHFGFGDKKNAPDTNVGSRKRCEAFILSERMFGACWEHFVVGNPVVEQAAIAVRLSVRIIAESHAVAVVACRLTPGDGAVHSSPPFSMSCIAI